MILNKQLNIDKCNIYLILRKNEKTKKYLLKLFKILYLF